VRGWVTANHALVHVPIFWLCAKPRARGLYVCRCVKIVRWHACKCVPCMRVCAHARSCICAPVAFLVALSRVGFAVTAVMDWLTGRVQVFGLVSIPRVVVSVCVGVFARVRVVMTRVMVMGMVMVMRVRMGMIINHFGWQDELFEPPKRARSQSS